MGGRRARVITYNNQSLTLDEWAAVTGISRDTIKSRIRLGWTTEEALGFAQHVNVMDATKQLSHPNQWDDGSGKQVMARMAMFLDACKERLRETHKFQPAYVAEEVGIDYATVKNWRDNNEWFDEAMHGFKELEKQLIEDHVTDIVYDPAKFDNALKRNGWWQMVMFKAKAEMPEKYRDNPPSVNIYQNTYNLGDVEQLIDTFWKAQEQRRLAAGRQKLIQPPVDGD